MKSRIRMTDIILRVLIWLSAIITVSLLVTIIYYILSNGLSHISWNFLTNIYNPTEDKTGILPMIINTMYIVVITLVIAVPIGISTAIYLTEYAIQGKLVELIRFTTEILSGIPSIIYGLFGFMFFVVFMDLKYSILAGSLTLAIMILPILIRTTEEALKAVPYMYREGALALGATKLRIIFTILLPNAVTGILTAVILSIGRIVGESAALIFTSGIVYRMPNNFFSHIFSSGRTLTIHLYQLAILGEPLEQTFATASVLLIIVLLINIVAKRLVKAFQNR